MPTLDATVGGASANSFVGLEDAKDYLDARLNTDAWDAADDEDKSRALIEATRDLCAIEPRYQGYRVTTTQVLAFPRTLVINPKAPWLSPIGLTGYPEYADDIIPPDLIAATCELALEYLRAGTMDVAAATTTGAVIEETVGPLTTRWAEPVQSIPTGLARFPRVVQLIEPLCADGGNAVVRS